MRNILLIVVLGGTLFGQYPIGANALWWTGAVQTGPFCWGFSCTPQAGTLVRGESGTLHVRAEFQQPYVLGLSLTATRCLAVQGFYNQLVIDDPITIFATGSCSQGSPILSCPGGTDAIPITIPLTLPVGAVFSIQGATGVPSFQGTLSASFTSALTFTVL